MKDSVRYMWIWWRYLLVCIMLFSTMLITAQEVKPESDKPEVEETDKSEFRGLWITRFEWPAKDPEACKEKIVTIMENLEEGNFNAAVFQIRGAADVLYPSELEPWSQIFDGKSPGFDTLEFAINEAHKRNIEFHAYINPIPLFTAGKENPLTNTTPEHLFYRHGPKSNEPWVCWDEDGNIMDGDLARRAQYYYLSPGIPEVHAYLRKVILDVVKRYDVDGIHLDRIRYPDRQYSHDPVSIRRFYGRGNPNRLEWADWQREQITKFINDLYAEIVAEKPHVVLSCAAWGIYNRYHIEGYYNFSSGYHDYYQDTWRWVQIGAMDILMPMIYWDIPDPKPNYNELMEDFAEGIGAEHIVGGQRIFSVKDSYDENVEEINVSRKLDALGTVLFAYGSAVRNNIFSRLKGSVYEDKVPVPELSWKNNPEYGIVMGTVVDDTGEPVEDAWVSLEPMRPTRESRRQAAFRQTWTSGADGRFAFLKAPSIPLKLVVQYDGVPPQEVSDIEVQPGEISKHEIVLPGAGEAKDDVFFHIFNPEDGEQTTRDTVHILGRTHPENSIQINGKSLEVYRTGGFAVDNIALEMGENSITIAATAPNGKQTTRSIKVIKTSQAPERTPSEEPFVTISEPLNDMSLLPGDILKVQARGITGWKGMATCWSKNVCFRMAELLDNEQKNTGIYQGSFRIPSGFKGEPSHIQVDLETTTGLVISTVSEAKVEVWDETQPRVGETIDDEVGITYGTHYVRLAGPYLTEAPKGTRFEIIGKVGGNYKIRLTPSLSGWVSEEDVRLLPVGTQIPHAFFTSCSISGDQKTDMLVVPYSEKVVFSITPETRPENRLLVDFYNTHLATTWMSHKTTATVIGAVSAKQDEDNHVQLLVPIKSKQIWGYWVEHGENALTIRIKRPPTIVVPPDSPVSGLTFGLEAGHGGRGLGAVGVMGTNEKTINSTSVEYLTKILEERGAQVVHMRPGDTSPLFSKRMQYAYDADADFIISMHANAAGNAGGFLRISGTSTYYKYDFCYRPAKLVYDELLKLGWGEFGVVGNFNYYPIRQTRVPSILVEQAFMSNPYDEARLLDPDYQQAQAEAIIRGIEQFLDGVRE